jgi:hypothetical protein
VTNSEPHDLFPPEQLDAIHDELCRGSLAYFSKHILRMHVGGFHVLLSEAINDHKRLGVQAYRDAGKSAFFSYAFPIWQAWRAPGTVTYIFSATARLANELLKKIKAGDRFTDPDTGEQEGLFALGDIPELAHLVDERNCTWNADEIQLSNGSRIIARGWGGAQRGPHPHAIVCDDVLDEKSLWSSLQREKAVNFLQTAITNMVAKNGWIVVVGTPFHEQDIYGWVEQNPVYQFYKFPGLFEDETAPQASDGKRYLALIPDRHDVEELLERRREIGEVAFAREILCQPISDNLSLFPKKLFVGDVMAHHVMWRPSPLQLKAWGWETYIGVDVAESSEVGADFFVITVIALDRDGNRYLIDNFRAKGLGFQEQLTTIADYSKRYRQITVFVESNAMQSIWPKEILRTTDIPVRPFYTGAQNKNSLATGVPSLRILLENGKLRFARGDAASIDATDIYISELQKFGWYQGKLQGIGAHDDTVMSLWIAIEASREATFKFMFPDQPDLDDGRSEVLAASTIDEAGVAAVRLVLAGGEIACDEVLYDEGGLRDYLASFAHRSNNLAHIRAINRELARLDESFGYDDDVMLLVGT